jgi:hypothetical protein
MPPRPCRHAYAATLAAHGLMLLYTTPWPPSGIWSRQARPDAASLRGLKIRTFDATSTDVFRAAGSAPEQVSFADAMPKLRAGELDAVLSSGDGGAGARLWEILPHLTSIDHAWRLSLAFAPTAALGALSAPAREAVMTAGGATEARQWQAIGTRLAEDSTRMQAAGVRMADGSTPLRTALREAAAPVLRAWEARAGEAGTRVLAAYRGWPWHQPMSWKAVVLCPARRGPSLNGMPPQLGDKNEHLMLGRPKPKSPIPSQLRSGPGPAAMAHQNLARTTRWGQDHPPRRRHASGAPGLGGKPRPEPAPCRSRLTELAMRQASHHLRPRLGARPFHQDPAPTAGRWTEAAVN